MYIKKFEDISKNDVTTAGGKGASLREMINAGIPVPSGFVVTTKAFKDFSDKTFSETFKKEVLSAFDKLKTGRVAVRSSAVAEDSSSASWAGQLESYLNVSRENLLENIILCFGSIKSDRAKAYAKDNKTKKDDLAVAVVVQKMVNSEVSGVIFTANPVTGNKDEIVIESGYGLGEYIVQGIITPDNYIVDKNKLSILNKDLGSKDKMYAFDGKKNKSINVSEKLRDKFSLNDNQVIELTKLGKRIEDHYGFPCDIEWAFEKGRFYITQSRPITTLPDPSNVKEKTNLPPWDNEILFRWGPMPGKIFYLSDYVDAASQLKKYLGTSFPGTLLLFHNVQMVWICVQKEMTESGMKIFTDYVLKNKNMIKWHQEFDMAVARLENFQNKLETNKIDTLSKTDLKNIIQEFYKLAVNFWLPTIPAELGNYGSTEVLKENLSRIIKNKKELTDAIQILTTPEEISYNQQEEIDLSNATDLEKHLNNYFWLQNNYSGSKILNLSFFEKRKKELDKNLKEKVKQKIKMSKEEKKKIIDKYNLPGNIVKMSNLIWKNIIWQDKRKGLSLLTHFYRFTLLKRASVLLNINIDILENYFYKDIITALESGKLDTNSSHAYIGTTIKNNLMLDEAEVAWNNFAKEQIGTSEKNQLLGIVASKGKKNITTGKVSIVFDPQDDFEEGSILVSPTTSPEFVILMRKALAIITNTGGLTSHAAIVSRELSIPCIVGTKSATEILKNGDTIKLNTNNGTVTKI